MRRALTAIAALAAPVRAFRGRVGPSRAVRSRAGPSCAVRGRAGFAGRGARALASTSDAAADALREHTAFVNAGAGPAAKASDRAAHNTRQAAVFDDAAAYFASPEASPPEVEAVLDKMAARITAPAAEGGAFRVLDVGCGTGCLSRRYALAAPAADVSVVGVDLSSKMLEAARAKGGDNIEYVVADVVDYAAKETSSFDAVVFNACFGNIFDRAAALEAAASVLKPGGKALVTHPLSADFVDELHEKDPSVVPFGLPRSLADMQALAGGGSLTPEVVEDRSPYWAAWVQVV